MSAWWREFFFSSYLSIYPWLWDSRLKIPYFFAKFSCFFAFFPCFFSRTFCIFLSRNFLFFFVKFLCISYFAKSFTFFLESEQNEKKWENFREKRENFAFLFFRCKHYCKLVDPHLNYCRLNYSSFELLFVLTKLIMTPFPVVHSTHYFLIWTIK